MTASTRKATFLRSKISLYVLIATFAYARVCEPRMQTGVSAYVTLLSKTKSRAVLTLSGRNHTSVKIAVATVDGKLYGAIRLAVRDLQDYYI